MRDDVETRLRELGMELPDAPVPVAGYRSVVLVHDMAYVSGQGPTAHGAPVFVGRVGLDLTEKQGREAAALCALNALAALRAELGGLDGVERIVKVLGFVASGPDFYQQPEIIDGASLVLNELFAGGHARSSIGTHSLPFNIPVEIELVAHIAAREEG